MVKESAYTIALYGIKPPVNEHRITSTEFSEPFGVLLSNGDQTPPEAQVQCIAPSEEITVTRGDAQYIYYALVRAWGQDDREKYPFFVGKEEHEDMTRVLAFEARPLEIPHGSRIDVAHQVRRDRRLAEGRALIPQAYQNIASFEGNPDPYRTLICVLHSRPKTRKYVQQSSRNEDDLRHGNNPQPLSESRNREPSGRFQSGSAKYRKVE